VKKQLTDAIKPVYLRSQRHHRVRYANRFLRELLAQRLIDNQTAMHQPWDPNTSFETLIKQLEDGIELADAANQAYTDAQVLTLAYTLVYNIGLYFDECKHWKARPAQDQTWNNFKTAFLTAQTELRLQQQATSSRTSFSAFANDKENQATDALANLAEATAADRHAFCQLVTTNSDLAVHLQTALSEIQHLKNLVLASTGAQTQDKAPRLPRKPTNSYCWTHGYRVAEGHNSATCKNPKTGHQKDANKNSTMNGSTAGQGT
jgi:hypothetical protein